MDTQDLLKEVRKIEIKSRGLTNQIFAGEYHSAFKGRGMAFSEVREYQPGDEIRTIDWNVTARFNHPFVKVFEEEREMTVMLVIDVSGSADFGSGRKLKQQVILELAAVLAFSAIKNNDKVGVIFFSDKVEKFIVPKKGSTHILTIIRELIDFKPENKGTDVAQALKYLTSAIKKRCTAFLISDFLDDDFRDALKIANKKHDVVALKVSDKREEELPNIGIIPLKDNETDKITWVNTSSSELRNQYRAKSLQSRAALRDVFNKSGVDFAEIDSNASFVRPLINLFKLRESRR
ncbi:MAG: DUF58 domain-containing protein [Vicingaceae bacterium]